MLDLCPVCREKYIDRKPVGRGMALTCGSDCSEIRNSVGDDEAAARKYDKLNQGREAYDRFCLGKDPRREIHP